MKIILSKKINPTLVVILLYLSFCFGNFVAQRGNLAASLLMITSGDASMSQADAFSNSVVAFIFAGVFPLLLYELITQLAMRQTKPVLGLRVVDMRYALRFFYICANLLIGALSFLYYINPLISIYGQIFIDFFVYCIFFALFMVFCAKNYVEKQQISKMIMLLGGFFLGMHFVFTIFSFFI